MVLRGQWAQRCVSGCVGEVAPPSLTGVAQEVLSPDTSAVVYKAAPGASYRPGSLHNEAERPCYLQEFDFCPRFFRYVE